MRFIATAIWLVGFPLMLEVGHAIHHFTGQPEQEIDGVVAFMILAIWIGVASWLKKEPDNDN